MIAGMESRNESSAAFMRSAPRKSAVTMVIPAREIPGNTAHPCAIPMIRASRGPMPAIESGRSAWVRSSSSPKRFESHRITPLTRSSPPTTAAENTSDSTGSFSA